MNQTTGFVFDPKFLNHVIEPGHPESPERLRAIQKKLVETGIDRHLQPVAPTVDPLPYLNAIHSDTHIKHILALPGTGPIAALATSGALTAVDAVCRGVVPNAFCALRPPGHHAHNLGM